MRVIEGHPWELELECYQCETKLVACLTDINLSRGGPYVDCPMCLSSNRINYADVPAKKMIDLIKKRWDERRT